MRVNIYFEELPEHRRVKRVETIADTGVPYEGIRIFLKSPSDLHDTDGDDDRSAVTFWGPRDKVARLLREAAKAMDGNNL